MAVHFYYAFLPGRHLSLQRNISRLTTRYSAQLNVLMYWRAKRKTTVARGHGFLSAVLRMGKRPTEALGLIYLACQGQDPPKWGNMLTPLPEAWLLFSPLCISPQSGSVDMKQETQNRSSGQLFFLTFRLILIIFCACWCFKMGSSFHTP